MSFLTLLLLSLVPRTITSGPGSRRPCTDQLPLDLLAHVLPGGASVPPPGLRMIQTGGVRGVRFSHPHPSLSFPSSQLLGNCDLFPSVFSLVVTLKVTRNAPKRNEYIFSVVGEDDGENEKSTEEEDEKSDEERNGENTDTVRTREKDGRMEGVEEKEGRRERGVDRGRLLLGLLLARDRFHFLFRGHGGVAERWVFRGVRLADHRWHTLVLAVTGRHARLTADCNTPLELSVHSRSFPSNMVVQGTKFHIGSQGRRKGLFSGLIRQLVLVPGSDATPDVCPSSTPRLAALSVPSVLLDLPVKETETGLTLPAYEAEVRVSVGSERSCSASVRGQLWFSPLRRGLYLCDGLAWVPMLQERERLDYVEEHQILSTSSESYDIEVFRVAGVGLMAAMAHRSPALGSAIYLWTHGGFQLYQNLSTHGALAWRHFTMGRKVFLVVSNSAGGPDEEEEDEEKAPGQEEGAEMSVIYKWSKRRKRFVHFQSLQTHCARDWEAFRINRHTYLAVANHRQGDNSHVIDSAVYKWNPGTRSFQLHQKLRTSGAYDWEFFTVGPYHFLVVANAFDGVTTHVDSVIYVWLKGNFQVFQTIKTFCATDWEMFQIGSRVFLVVANGHRLHGNGPSRYAINSTIYELDVNAQLFIRFQDIVTFSAVDWEFFTLGEENFLVVANSFDGESYSLNSVLYRWQGYEGFVPVHRLPTIGCSDWEFFHSEGESYLIYSSAKAPLSKVFKLKTL